MVAEGVIIPKPDEAPPTVPMDYNWARVITVQSLYNTHCYLLHRLDRECRGSVVECLTEDRRPMGSSLTGITALCP